MHGDVPFNSMYLVLLMFSLVLPVVIVWQRFNHSVCAITNDAGAGR